MPPPVGGAKQYDAKLRKKDVKVEVGSMGLQVWPKKGSVPTTYLYQTLLSWEVVEPGFDIVEAGGNGLSFVCPANHAEEICDGMTARAQELAQAQAREQGDGARLHWGEG